MLGKTSGWHCWGGKGSPCPGPRCERPFPQVPAEMHTWHNVSSASHFSPAQPGLVVTCSGARELKSRRRGAPSQLVLRPTLSPEGVTTALVIADPGCFWAKASLAVNKLLLTAGEFWGVLASVNRCKTCTLHFFDNCSSQVSLLSRLLIPKSRELEVQSQPTENLQVSAPCCWPRAQHSLPQSHPAWESFRANYKAYTCLKRAVYQAAGRASRAVLLWAAWDWFCCPRLQEYGSPCRPSHPSATHHLSRSKTGTVLLTHCCCQLQQSCPSPALLTCCCPKPHAVGFCSEYYSLIALSHFQEWDYQIVLAKN